MQKQFATIKSKLKFLYQSSFGQFVFYKYQFGKIINFLTLTISLATFFSWFGLFLPKNIYQEYQVIDSFKNHLVNHSNFLEYQKQSSFFETEATDDYKCTDSLKVGQQTNYNLKVQQKDITLAEKDLSKNFDLYQNKVIFLRGETQSIFNDAFFEMQLFSKNLRQNLDVKYHYTNQIVDLSSELQNLCKTEFNNLQEMKNQLNQVLSQISKFDEFKIKYNNDFNEKLEFLEKILQQEFDLYSTKNEQENKKTFSFPNQEVNKHIEFLTQSKSTNTLEQRNLPDLSDSFIKKIKKIEAWQKDYFENVSSLEEITVLALE